jgi:LysM repeat protein
VDERKDSYFLTGQSRQNSMDYRGAAEAFERALEVNPRSASAHFELGLLYEQKLNDGVISPEERDRNYVTAIYHFEKHLQLRPHSNHAETIRNRIKSCKFELAKSGSFTLTAGQFHQEFEKLSRENQALRQEVVQLQTQLAVQSAQRAQLQDTPVRQPPPAAELPVVRVPESPRQNPVNPPRTERGSTVPQRPQTFQPASFPARSYEVRAGDTMASIARRHGISLTALQAANPGVQPSRIKPGQRLIIPGRNG